MYNDPDQDVNSRREFLILENSVPTPAKIEEGSFEFSAHQLFVRNFVNPYTQNKRVHIKSGTGVGKTNASLLAAKEFIKLDRQVLIVGFQENRFYSELMSRVELGYVTKSELSEMNRLRNIYESTRNEEALNRLKSIRTTIKRRFNSHITIQGYKKFMHELIGVDGTNDPQLNFGIVEKYRYGLIIYDESQNAYNSEERNNWGRAIQLLLNLLGPDIHALSVSATPITVSTELRDFLHLMTETPRFNIKELQHDIEESEHKGDRQTIIDLINSIVDFKHPSLLELALPRELNKAVITAKLRGKILFMPDAVLENIPTRIYHGESIPGLKFLKFIRVTMSPRQEKKAKQFPTDRYLRDIGGLLDEEEILGGENPWEVMDISPEAQGESPNEELDEESKRHNEIHTIMSPDYAEYRDKIGLQVQKTDIGYYLSGSFLREPNLSLYSTKYSEMLKLIKNAKLGKILIYHNEVHGTGILTLQEVFLQNGILSVNDSPNDFTLCTFCGNMRKDPIHTNKLLEPPFDITTPHGFAPMRYLSISSAISKIRAREVNDIFNSPRNLWGQEFRIMLGSRMIREGVDFKAVQTQIILSMSGNIPILIQLFGRSARNYSHIDLPAENNYVHMYILVSSFKDKSVLSPEEMDYKSKIEDYLLVQYYDDIMNRIAVDSYILHTSERLAESIKNNYKFNTDTELDAQLGPQPFIQPPREQISAALIKNVTYNALERFEEEINLIQYMVIKALNQNNIWTLQQMWDYIRHQKGTPNPALFDYKNFLIACRSIGSIKIIGEYILKGSGEIEEHSRQKLQQEPVRLMQISYFKDEQLMNLISQRVTEKKTAQNTVSLLQVYDIFERYDIDVHLRVIRRVIEDVIPTGLAFYAALFKLYTARDLRLNISNQNKIMGYNYNNKMYFLSSGNNWRETSYVINEVENNILIGMYTPNMEFKIRSPNKKNINQAAGQEKAIDLRKVERGIVCSTKNKTDLMKIAKDLEINLESKSARISSICEAIKLELLKRESKQVGGYKWVYLH